MRLKATSAANRWHRSQFPDATDVLTLEATDYEFDDSVGIWLEAPHHTERLALRKVFGVGLRAWADGLLLVTWIGPASEPMTLEEARQIFATARFQTQ